MLCLLLALVAVAAPWSQTSTDIYADHWRLQHPWVIGHGNVRLNLDMGTLTAASIGANLDTRTATATHAAFQSTRQSINLSAKSLRIRADGSLSGRRVWINPCDCDGKAPWQLSAKQVTVTPGTSVRFSGAAFRVARVPVMWVPYGVLPLRRKSGLLPPQLGWGQQGFFVAQPVYITLGRSADATLTPELRTKRSLRAIGQLRYATRGGGGQVDGVVGYDTVTHSVRGGARWHHRTARGRWSVTAHAELPGDLDYLADYADQFLTRRVPWYTTRGLVTYRGVELSTERFRLATNATQEIASLALYRPSIDLPGGLVLSAGGRTYLLAQGTTPWSLGSNPVGLGVSQVTASRPTRWGPVVLTPSAALMAEGALGSGATGVDPHGRITGTAALRWQLPLWHKGTRRLHRLEPTLELVATAQHGELPPTARTTPDALGWDVRPGLLYRSIAPNDQLMEVRAGLGRRQGGWQAHLDAALQTNRWTGYAQLQSPLGQDRGRGHREWLDLGTVGLKVTPPWWLIEGKWHIAAADTLWNPTKAQADVHQVIGALAWTLPGLHRTLRLGGEVGWDLGTQALVSPQAHASYTHPTGCLRMALTARWAPDRTLPDVSVQVHLTAGQRTTP